MGKQLELHKPCPDCNSSDALSLYENEKGEKYTKCYSCEKVTFLKDDVPMPLEKKNRGKIEGFPEYGILKATSKHYGVTSNDQFIYYPYGDDGYKVRAVGEKKFHIEGKLSMLFGQNLFPKGGRYVTIVEGERDALAAFQMAGSKYAFVSIPNGAQSALKACQEQYEWLDSFENIIICFDGDAPGQQAARAVAELFSGKSKVVKHKPGFKDASDYLQASKSKEFMEVWWAAETHTPDGIVQGSNLWDLVSEPVTNAAVDYPFTGLNDLTYGIRKGELVMITAGSGLGKSQFVKEIVWHVLNKTQDNVGLMFLEESVKRTAQSIMSLSANLPLHLPHIEISDDDFKSAFDATLGTNRLFLFDHFGSTSVDNIVSKVRYMVKAMDCGFVFLDHVSIVVSAGNGGDERKALDEIMTKLRMLVQETNVALICVSHLRRPEGRGHEEGAATSLGQLRGSGGIGQLSDIVIGLERNGQAEDLIERHTTRIRVLKNRFSGLTGPAAVARYFRDTGRMLEVVEEQEL